MMVEVCPDAGLTMRFDIPMWQSGDLAARTINHLAIFVAERAGWLKHPSKSPRHPANVGWCKAVTATSIREASETA